MLKKLSLAALVAMGSMSVASATPLTEAIKGVDLSGMLRIRYYHEMPKDANSYNRWRTNGIFIFTVPASEELKFVFRNSVESNVYTDDDQISTADSSADVKAQFGNHTSTAVDDAIANNLLFAKYSKDGLNVILGKIPVPTSVTSKDPATPAHGAGAIATYAVNKNLTVGAAYVDALKQGGIEATSQGLNVVIPNDIYAAVAVFNTDMVSGNAWYYKATNLVKNIFTLSVDVKPIKFADVHVDYAQGKLEGNNQKTKNYFNVSAAVKQDALSAKIGYAKADKDSGVVVLAKDAPIGAVIPTANNYNIANAIDKTAIYAKVGYNVDAKTNVYLAYQHQNDKTTKNNDLDEFTLGGSYAYNKKVSLSAYYDDANFKNNTKDNKEFRFEAKYSF